MKKLILLVFLGAFLLTSCGYMNKTTVTATVLDKERITEVVDGNTNSYYVIFTDVGEYQISDQLFVGKFNSSTLYGKLKEGKTYEFTIRGYRSGFLSMYPNIQEYREIIQPE